MSSHRSPVLRFIRIASAVVFVGTVVGLIVSSVAGNNEGWVLSIGMVGAVTAIVLIATSAATATQRNPAFSDVVAESVENHIERLVAAGADEAEVRELVRDAMKLGRGL